MRSLVCIVLAACLAGGCAGASTPVAESREAPVAATRSRPRPRGWLRSTDIDRVVRAGREDVRLCYQRALDEAPWLRGRVDVRFVIAPNGTVESARVVRATLEDAGVHACIVAVIRGWRFPPPDGNGWLRLTFPFLFGSG